MGGATSAEETLRQMYIITGCLYTCICSSTVARAACKARTVTETLRRNVSGCTFITTTDNISQNLHRVCQSIVDSHKIIILWNKDLGNCFSRNTLPGQDANTGPEKSESESGMDKHEMDRFVCEVELALYRASTEGHTDSVVHVELEQGALPEELRSQWTPVIVEPDDPSVLIPAITATDDEPLRPGWHVADGLVWTFVVGYLMKVLPDFHTSVTRVSETCENCYRRLLVVIPRTGLCPATVLGCENSGRSIESNQTVGGVLDRSYKTTVYTVKDPAQPQHLYHAAVEYATPVRGLYAMARASVSETLASSASVDAVDKQWLQHELVMFARLLPEVTQKLLGERASFMQIVDFDDTDYGHLDVSEYKQNEDLQHSFQSQLLDVIQREAEGT